MEFPVFLLDKEEWGGHGGFGGSNAAQGEVLIKELVEFLLLGAIQGVDLAVEGIFGVGDELDCMVPGFAGGEFVEVFLFKEVGEVSICFGDHLFKGLLFFPGICFHG